MIQCDRSPSERRKGGAQDVCRERIRKGDVLSNAGLPGMEYGWGVARYDTFERLFGADFVTSAYDADPRESRQILVDNLIKIAGPLTEKQINKIIGK